jgi:hypothetical protein
MPSYRAGLMRHRIANIQDSEILGELNHQLIKDEGHRNSMTTPELVERMRSWLITDYRASIFEDDTGILVYALTRKTKIVFTCGNSSCNAVIAVPVLVANP